VHRFAACLLSLLPAAAAMAQGGREPPPTPPEPVTELPARFSCIVSREGPLGTIGVQQSVSPAGVADEPIFSWSARIGTDGISLDASWSAQPRNYSLIQLAYLNPDRRRTYRIRVQRHLPPTSGPTYMSFEGPLTPTMHGFVSIWTEWGPLIGMLSDALDPHILVLDGEAAIVVDERVDPALFARAHDMAERLRPELDAMVADHRNRCPFQERFVLPR
jgi:hypothetical protein